MAIDTKVSKDINDSGFDNFLQREIQTDPNAAQQSRNQLPGNLLSPADWATITSDLVPSSSAVFDIGTIFKTWNKIYAKNLRLTAVTSGFLKADANGDVSAASITNADLPDLVVSDFAGAAIVTEAEGVDSSDNDTSLPTTAAVKDYVDTNISTESQIFTNYFLLMGG